MEKAIKILATNKKANFNYFLSDFLECGIELKGSEVKSLRHKGASLAEAYIVIKDEEAYVLHMHITPYEKGTIFNPDPKRSRKLLMHKKEIRKYYQKAKEQKMTIIPTKLYLKKGKVKLEIALGKGKKLYDKRETLKLRDDQKAMAKAMKTKGEIK